MVCLEWKEHRFHSLAEAGVLGHSWFEAIDDTEQGFATEAEYVLPELQYRVLVDVEEYLRGAPKTAQMQKSAGKYEKPFVNK